MMRPVILLMVLMLGGVSAMAEETTDSKAIAFGKALAEQNCATCHAITATGPSPLLDAPPFRDLAAGYDEGELEDAFNEGVATDHPVMPDWEMTPEQAHALASYIMTLAQHGERKTELSP